MSVELQLPPGRHVLIWQYTVRPEATAKFRAFYNSDGEWVRLFAKADGFCGTSLLQDNKVPDKFVTLDVWDSAAAFDRFKHDFSDAYAELDKRCEQLTEDEQFVGAFKS